MAELKTISGQTILLDDEDFSKVEGHSWLMDIRGCVYTRISSLKKIGKCTALRMHRLLAGVELGRTDKLVKFKNGNKLDMRSENLIIQDRKWQHKAHDIECACGCGQKIRAYRPCGLRKRFADGHHPKKYRTDQERQAAITRISTQKTANSQLHYRNVKRLAMELLGNGCYFCGLVYDGKNASVFEFDHINPAIKEGSVTKLMRQRALDPVAEELSKCRLVCANCHNIRHGGIW